MWSALAASTVTSRTFLPLSTRTRAIAPSLPPASPIACASSANAPGRSSTWTRTVALNDAEGRNWLISGMLVASAGNDVAREATRRLRADPGVRGDRRRPDRRSRRLRRLRRLAVLAERRLAVRIRADPRLPPRRLLRACACRAVRGRADVRVALERARDDLPTGRRH